MRTNEADSIVVDVFAYAGTLWRRKGLIIVSSLVCFAAGWGGSYTRPKLYQSQVRFMPPVKTVSTMLFSLSRSNGDEYRAMLNSYTVASDVVAHQNLMGYFHVDSTEMAIKLLQGMSRFAIDSDNFLTITVVSKEPETSQKIAAEYYAALYRLTERIAANETEHRLNFMAGPLQTERDRLNEAENAYRDAQTKTGLVLPQAQAALGVQQVSTLQARISELQTELATASLSSTNENPRVLALRTQLATLEGQLGQLQSKSSQANSPAQLPQLGLEVERAEREVRFHSTTLEALTRALAASSMQENYTPSFSLIDSARIEKTKVSPPRKQWALVGLLLGFLLSSISVLASYGISRWRTSRTGRSRLAAWSAAFRGEARDA